MAGLTDRAGDPADRASHDTERAWRDSMTRQMASLRQDVRARHPGALADRCGAAYADGALHLPYWGAPIDISWPDLEARESATRDPCSTFDTAMLLYYLHTADGAPLANRWIGFRELPDGAFYHQAFQGYTGTRLARTFGHQPDDFDQAARALGGSPLPALTKHAYAFLPLPRLPVAAALWPGDDDFPAQASVLFDAAASHYMVTDGLALLGAGLASRLLRRAPG